MYPVTKLDIFRLGYILSRTRNTGKELIYIDPFLANVPVLYPPKSTRKPKVFRCLQGV